MDKQSKVLVINLERDRHRFDAFSSKHSSLCFERVNAVYGASLAEDYVRRFYYQDRFCFERPLTRGEIGCYLSHRRCWEKIVNEELPFAVILEDDVVLEESFEHLLKSVAKIQKSWDYLKISDTANKRGYRIIQDLGEHDLISYCKVPITTMAQIVSFEGAKKLLVGRQRFCRPVDVDIQYYWEVGLDVFGLHPYPVGSASFESSISQDGTRKRRGSARVFGFWRKLRYNVLVYWKYLEKRWSESNN